MGRCSKAGGDAKNQIVTADMLNNHYAVILTDADYKTPRIKNIANNHNVSDLSSPVSEGRMFKILNGLQHTAATSDNLPAWFLKIGALFFASPITTVMNLSLAFSTVPLQWEVGSILPVPKISIPPSLADYRLITITFILSRIL